jgi:hypothetical protein
MPTGWGCYATSDCCSGLLCNSAYGACYTCGVVNWRCNSTTECCSGHTCSGGYCT